MIRPRTNRQGATLTELIVVVAMASVVGLAFVLFFSKNTAFYKRSNVRQRVMLDARVCMDTMLQHLRNGKARTVVIRTPAGPPVFPNSRIDFELQTELPSGATAYGIYLDNGSVLTQEYVKTAPPQPLPRPVATHVSSLMFTGDSQDPGIVQVSLKIDAPWDDSKDPSHVSTLLLPNQTVHLVETP